MDQQQNGGYQKPENDIGAAWEKQNRNGGMFLSVKLDLAHSPKTAFALANMLMSGQPVTFMASVTKKYDGTVTSKVPKYSLYMPKPQHDWTLQNYQKPYPPASAPVYDYRTQGAAQQQNGFTPPAPPYAPAPQQNTAAQSPVNPNPPAASPNNVPLNPFGA